MLRAIQFSRLTGSNLVHPDSVITKIDQQFPQSLERLFELLRFPSVATDPKHDADCVRAVEWLVRLLRNMGFKTRRRKTTGQPLVVGTYWPSGGGTKLPHILFYGHYDVQPADPVELWTTPPFEPQIRKGGKVINWPLSSQAPRAKMQSLPFLPLRICGSKGGVVHNSTGSAGCTS